MKGALLSLLLLAGALPEAEAASGPRALSFLGPRNRVLTPNGDGRNDVVVFELDNPAFAAVTGRIYDLRGGLVATMVPVPNRIPEEAVYWDGKAAGRAAPSGVYIYVIEVETKIFRGSLLVIK